MGQHQLWEYRSGALVVEKFTGEFSFEDVLQTDADLIQAFPKNADIVNVADLTEATFNELHITQISNLIQNLLHGLSGFKSFKLALVANLQFYNDFDKAYQYVHEASKEGIMAKQFLDINSALRWVGVTSEEERSILLQTKHQTV